MSRYSSLHPLSQDERRDYCALLFGFFSFNNNQTHRNQLGLPITPNALTPLSLNDFFKWAKGFLGADLDSKSQRIVELVLKLEEKGILTKAGTSGSIPGRSNCYYSMYELSNLQKKGWLWLGTALGPEYVGHYIKTALVFITGQTQKGDIAVGTGTLILPGIILTCAHVIADMKVDEYVLINSLKYKVKQCIFDPNIDVGIIYLKKKIIPQIPDIAFRSAHILEEAVVAGYPTVPRGIKPVITLNRGEISGHVETMDKYPLTLFSSIARPGNSGGPVVGRDGRIIGIVTQSLERPREDADMIGPLPFFAAVPSDIIRDSFRKLTKGLELPWEDYQ